MYDSIEARELDTCLDLIIIFLAPVQYHSVLTYCVLLLSIYCSSRWKRQVPLYKHGKAKSERAMRLTQLFIERKVHFYF